MGRWIDTFVGRFLVMVFTSGMLLAQTGSVSTQVADLLNQALTVQTPQRAEELLDQAQALLKADQTKIDELKRGFLSADIVRQRGRVFANFALQTPQDKSFVKSARKYLLKSIEQYELLIRQAERKSDRVLRNVSQSAMAGKQRWRQLAGYPSRAKYSMAWSYYSLGLIETTDSKKNQSFSKALELFGDFVEMGYIDNSIVSDCFLGYGYCLFQQGQYADVRDLLNDRVIRPDNTSQDLFQRVTMLRIKNYQQLKSYWGVEKAAEVYFQSFGKDGDYGPFELDLAIWRIEALAQLVGDTPENPYRQGGREKLMAVCGPLMQRQDSWAVRAGQVLDEVGIDTVEGNLIRARRLYQQGDYQAALAVLDAALGLESRADSVPIAEIRYVRCLCLNKLQRWDQAVSSAKQYITLYDQSEVLHEVIAIAMESSIQWVKHDPQAVSLQEFDELTTYDQSLSNDGQGTLRWYKGNFLIAKGMYEQAWTVLSATVALDGEYYPRNLYLQSYAAYKLCQKESGAVDVLRAGAQAVRRFTEVRENGSLPDGIRRGVLDVGISLIDLCMQRDVESTEVLSLLEAVEKLDVNQSHQQQKLLAIQLPCYAKYGSLEPLKKLLEQRISPADIDERLSNSILKAVVYLEDRSGLDSPGDKVALMAGLFEWLSVGNRTDSLEDSKNKVLFMLAETLYQSGAYQKAVRRYEQLLQNESKHYKAAAMRGLGLCYEALTQYRQAVDYWRYLSRALSKYSEDWYDANYRLIWCTYQIPDKDKADKLLEYCLLKHGAAIPSDWADKFKQLGSGGRL